MKAFAFLLAVAASFGAAASADAETAATIKTRTIEASVDIDAKLKAHPGLFENLLAEGKRHIEKERREADRMKREEPVMFRQGAWTSERSYLQLSVVADRYVSILRGDDTYSGGAHPNLNWDTILWDKQAKKPISIRPFFRETADNGATLTNLARHARLSVAAEKIERAKGEADLKEIAESTPEKLVADDPSIANGIQPSLLKLGPAALAPSTVAGKSAGLTFHYGRYAVGAYAEGDFTGFVHWSRFKDHLTPEGLAVFGGDKPEGE
jgi:hypothetical protein